MDEQFQEAIKDDFPLRYRIKMPEFENIVQWAQKEVEGWDVGDRQVGLITLLRHQFGLLPDKG
jgi:hypothetical protein